MDSAAAGSADAEFAETGLVPPYRLGALLGDARAARGLTLEDVVSASAGRLSLSRLASIERGTARLADDDLALLAQLYRLDPATAVPARSQLVMDLSGPDGPAPDRREVLARYLSMVYSMRHAQPGSPVALRVEDLDVLGTALRLGGDAIRADLEALMAEADGIVARRHRLLRRKVLLPAAGILVAVSAAGALVFSQGASAQPPSGRTAATGTAPAVLGPAVVQERNADGSPGPVRSR